jgi:hypothetical protein
MNRTPPPSGGRRWRKWILIAAAPIALLLFLPLVLIGAWEAFVRPVPPPAATAPDIAAWLESEVATSSTVTFADRATSGAPTAAGDATTSATRLAVSIVTDRFPRDLPPGLHGLNYIRDQVVTEFDKVARLMIDYERERPTLDVAARWDRLEIVSARYYYLRKWVCELDQWDRDILSQVGSDDWRALAAAWYDLALLDQTQSWLDVEIARLVEGDSRYRDDEGWKMAALRFAHHFNRGSDDSAFGPGAWDREVYYWRRFGGFEGYYRIGAGAIEHRYRAWRDRLRYQPLRKALPPRLDLN